jgi:hypothetical protein
MTDRNGFFVSRSIWTSEVFEEEDGEPFSRRLAWIWLISEAAWKDRPIRIDGKQVTIQRGQLSHSVRFLADKWNWSKSQVGRFLKELESWDMIEINSGTKQSILTICNYNEYQLTPGYSRDNPGTVPGTKLGQSWDNPGTKKNQGIKKSNTPLPPTGGDAAAPLAAEEEDDIQLPPIHPAAEPAKPRADVPGTALLKVYEALGGKVPKAPSPEESDFDAFWMIFPRRPNNPRKPALEKYLKARRNGATHAEIMAGAQALAAEWRKRPKAELQYCPQATTWLNQERWKDVAQPVQAEPAGSPGAMDGMWRDLVTRYRTPRKEWPMGMGPAPDQPGCKAPVHILAEFGYNVAA